VEVRLYIENIAYTTTEDDLRTLFAKAGEVTKVMLIKDLETGDPKGFAFVEMITQVEAEQAIGMFNGFNLNNRQLKVRLAKRRSESSRQSGHKRH